MFPLKLRVALLVVLCCCLFYGCSKAGSGPDSKPTLPTKYVVQPGDNLTNIAIKFYGDERQRKLLFEANSDVLKSPDEISIGQILKIPALPEKSEESEPTSQTPPTLPAIYEVRSGDKLSDIAARYYSDPELAYLISNANKEVVHNDTMEPNTKLFVPDLTAYMPLH